jgi:tRNA (guanine37-N1)-methyltransferase
VRFNLVTLFPEYFDSPLSAGLMAKARERGLVEFSLVDPRDFTQDKHRTVDDRPYGGGPGMVMGLDPLVRALESLPKPGRVFLLSPAGRPLTQALCRELSGEEAVTVICGRYEGIDARLFDLFPITPVSVGDFVLCGGEAAAACLVEGVARLLPGFMGHEQSGEEESFSAGLLEYPHYTRPEEYRGLVVPEALLSGDHARIAAWRKEQSLALTLARRPDILPQAALSEEDAAFLRSLPRARLGRNLYLALVHYPVMVKSGEKGAVSLTNLDVHDMGRVSRSYGMGGLYLVTPIEDQQSLARTLLGHWTEGKGRAANPDRAEALGLVRVCADLDEAVRDVAARAGENPRVVATSARMQGSLPLARVREWLADGPVLLLLGTGHGLAPEVIERSDGVLPPIRFLDGYNHLAVRSAAAIVADRLLSDTD